MSINKVNLLNFDFASLGDFFESLGEPRYRAAQLMQCIHQQGVTDFSDIHNFSKALREKLRAVAEIVTPAVLSDRTSQDGTRKWVMQMQDGNAIEAVFIPQAGRGTLCVSSQVGCALQCDFCATGKQGFSRNLSLAEIIGQIWVAVRLLSQQGGRHDRMLTNVVMMGMGEPLLNFEAVVKAMDIMMHDLAYGLSKYRVTLSTSGVVPEMTKLREVSPVALAVSLHAPTDALRTQLMPINKKYPLTELMAVCREYYRDEPGRRIMFEYVMLDGVNDRLQDAKALVRLLQGVPAKVNLIPFNPFPQTPYRTSSKENIAAFQAHLMKANIFTTVRLTRGEDTDSACGQLVGNVKRRIAVVRQTVTTDGRA